MIYYLIPDAHRVSHGSHTVIRARGGEEEEEEEEEEARRRRRRGIDHICLYISNAH